MSMWNGQIETSLSEITMRFILINRGKNSNGIKDLQNKKLTKKKNVEFFLSAVSDLFVFIS